ncbi:Aldo ket red domain containing protein, partial [Asbolus verrucosus]
ESHGLENEIVRDVKDAIDLGYRLFECAHAYNEKLIGRAIRGKIKEGKVKREDLFITSKLWCNRADLVESALKTTLKNLGLDNLDLYLIQWPLAFPEVEDLHLKNRQDCSEADYAETWKAMEVVYRKNLTKAIGVSNFSSQQIDKILNICTVFPQVNQVECHPYLNQIVLRKYCRDNAIKVMAHSPLGDSRTDTNSSSFDLLNNDRIEAIAERYGKTPAQILLRYNLQLENVVTSKSCKKGELLENINIFDFYLAPEDMSLINNFDEKREIR